ncbi:hypothetical protein [Embleya sp. NPDC020630]|uniref:hypothetical protein n=1 Tax=Embleya sp. NPDC020630 TaxID=3363979 RepID=UPI00378E61DE
MAVELGRDARREVFLWGPPAAIAVLIAVLAACSREWLLSALMAGAAGGVAFGFHVRIRPRPRR